MEWMREDLLSLKREIKEPMPFEGGRWCVRVVNGLKRKYKTQGGK